MKNSVIFCQFVCLCLGSSLALARDTSLKLKYDYAMSSPTAIEKLGTDVKFYFGSSTTPATAETFGEFMANKKTNAFNKTDEEACKWVFLSAMMSLRDRARSLNADAVINIKSYYKKNLMDSATEFECGAGGVMAGVTLKGTPVKLKKK